MNRRSFLAIAAGSVLAGQRVDDAAGWISQQFDDLEDIAAFLAEAESRSARSDWQRDFARLSYAAAIPWRPGVSLAFGYRGDQRTSAWPDGLLRGWDCSLLVEHFEMRLPAGLSDDWRAWCVFLPLDLTRALNQLRHVRGAGPVTRE